MKSKSIVFIFTIILGMNITNKVYTDTTTVQATNDGYISAEDASSYTTARDNTTADGLSANNVVVGQTLTPDPLFRVMRSFLVFTLPTMSAVEACSLYVKGAGADYSDDNFEMYIHTAPTYGGTLDTGDFDSFDGWVSGSAHTGTVLNETWNSSSFSSNTWHAIEFNSAGRDSILVYQESDIYITLISKEDYDRSEPSDKEYLSFLSSFSEGNEPYLSINYTSSTGYTGTACGLDDPADVLGVLKANLANFLGVE